jgi:cytosine permease
VTTRIDSTALDAAELPPLVRSDLAGPAIAPSSWVWTIGPAYAGLFVWVPFHDRVGSYLLSPERLWLQVASPMLAMFGCYWLLYYVPAMWGFRARQRLTVVAASTFGTGGAEWITGVLVGLAAVVWFAVAIAMGLRMTFLGLLSLGLIEPGDIALRSLGPISVESPVVLVTALFWIFILGIASLLRLPGVIVALMQVYTPVALLLLGLTAVWVSPGLGSFQRTRVVHLLTSPHPPLAVHAGPMIFQLLFGGFAFAGLLAAEWGRVVRSKTDVWVGGWVSIFGGGSSCALMSLITVAGSLDKVSSKLLPWPVQGSFHGAVFRGIGGIPGGAILLLFGLAALSQGCYAVQLFGERFTARWPRLRRFYWTWLGGVAAFGLIVTSWATELEAIAGVMGAVFAPAVGAITADALLHRVHWNGVRKGWNPAGLLAWGFGVLIGSLPFLGATFRQFQPASLFGYAAAAASYAVFARLGLERPVQSLPAGDDHGRSP